MVLSAISAMPVAVLAVGDGTIQLNATVKVVQHLNADSKSPAMMLAANDVMQLQSVSVESNNVRNDSHHGDVKLIDSKKSLNVLSSIPPQVWLVLTALFCFVMRSSRRVV